MLKRKLAGWRYEVWVRYRHFLAVLRDRRMRDLD
jgi:hypothetical protein